MFALDELGGIPGLAWERRALTFAKMGGKVRSKPRGAMEDVMEIRVYRSKGRKRVVPEPERVPRDLTGSDQSGGIRWGSLKGATASKGKKKSGIE